MNSLVMNYNINFPISIPISTELQLPRGLSKIREREGGGVSKNHLQIYYQEDKKRMQKKNKPKGDTRKHKIWAKIDEKFYRVRTRILPSVCRITETFS